MIVNQLACMEAGCPDVEVVCTPLRAKPRPKLMFKIYKAAKDLSSEEVEAAMKKANRRGGGAASTSTATPSPSRPRARCHDDCCEHEHGHGEHGHEEKHGGEHEHGHAEKH